MLILSRSINESIDIGDGIQVTVTAIRGGQVDLAIKAPKTISIKRTEAADPKEVLIPYETKHGATTRATDLPIFTNAKAVAQFLTNRQELRARHLEWIFESTPEAIQEWRNQFVRPH